MLGECLIDLAVAKPGLALDMVSATLTERFGVEYQLYIELNAIAAVVVWRDKVDVPS
jgi:hypothetical protein